MLDRLENTPMSCGGSQVSAPEGKTPALSRHWFGPFMERATHLGSAHLICTRATFERLGGFDEALKTGEDYDFCQKTELAGGQIFIDPSLRVDHYDFPDTWWGFVKRERWHGRGDTSSIGAFFASRVALVSVGFTTLTVLAVGALLLGVTHLASVLIAAALGLLIASSFARLHGVGFATRAISIWIFGLYYFGRSLSVFDAVVRGLRR